MKLLLDTHLLLWAAGEPRRLPKQARILIDNPDNELLFSAASLWEVVIKRGLGREDFVVDARLLRRGLLDNGYSELPIVSGPSLPSIACHRFIRILSTDFGGAGNCRGGYVIDQRLPRIAVPWSDQNSVRSPECNVVPVPPRSLSRNADFTCGFFRDSAPCAS